MAEYLVTAVRWRGAVGTVALLVPVTLLGFEAGLWLSPRYPWIETDTRYHSVLGDLFLTGLMLPAVIFGGFEGVLLGTGVHRIVRAVRAVRDKKDRPGMT